jgi:hypothetical protein
MWELEEEDEVFLNDFIAFLHKSKFLAEDVKPSEVWNNILIKLFVKNTNDKWKRQQKAKENTQKETQTFERETYERFNG